MKAEEELMTNLKVLLDKYYRKAIIQKTKEGICRAKAERKEN